MADQVRRDSATRFLGEGGRDALRALASAALPAGRRLPAPGEETLDRAEAFVHELGLGVRLGYRGVLAALEGHALARRGGRFSRLPLGARLGLLETWDRHEVTRQILRGLLAPIKLAYFEDEKTHAAAGSRHHPEPIASREEPRWQSQIVDGRTFERDEELECDVVVVGTGAGGAVVAWELAEAGWAVLLLEEGRHFTRREFTGRSLEMTRLLYRRGGLTVALGNTAIPIPVGRGVGGSTMINAGTCLRPPESTFAEWRSGMGLAEFSSESMDPHYRRVEAVLGVAPAEGRYLGGVGRLIGRGCDALGYSHRALTRNAPDCDGQSVCCFGCPTDAKRSTNVSFIPAALERSAQLITNVKVERVLREGDRAAGVVGTVRREDGRTIRLTARAKAVVLSCGTLHTPDLLLRNGLANSSGQLGRNLSIHPASSAFGVFDEAIDGSRAIPQGYQIDHFKGEGMMFEGGSAPLEILAASHSGFGPRFVELFERFNGFLQFGYMVKDTSRGRVRPGPLGEPIITYRLNAADLAKMRRALGVLCRVLFAAGARQVETPLFRFASLRDLRDVERLERASFAARHVDLSAYHPLGTSRMGRDPGSSVVSPEHETHDVRNLFIADGSSVPGSLGVNPQLTIMAMASRAAGFISDRLERVSSAGATSRDAGRIETPASSTAISAASGTS